MYILSIARRFIPAVLVIALILGCASMPELATIPERLTLEEVSAAEEVTTTEATTDEDTQEVEQAVGSYTDGVYTGTGTGYGGEISVQVTVEDGQIVSVEILSAADETESFLNRALAVIDSVLLYQTWEVDVVSGATYSSNGILNAIKNALTGEVTETETADTSGNSDALTEVSYTDPSAYADGTYTGSATGYGGTITVSVVIEDGQIASITITSASGETASYLTQAKAVIDAILSAQSPNVDTVSGATYSSNGIINAVKNALAKAATTASEEETDEEEEETVYDFSTLPNYGYADGTYTGTGIGYGGKVNLSVTVTGGQITEISVISALGETYVYWQQAIVLFDTIIQNQTPDVDVVAGATYSSNGIINAVKNALGLDRDEAAEEDTIDFSTLPNYGYTDGTYTGTGEGWGGDITVEVVVSGGQIVAVTITSAEDETYAYLNQASVLTQTVVLAQTWEVDVVSGATYSSQGILAAVQDALTVTEEPDIVEPDPAEPDPVTPDGTTTTSTSVTYTGTATVLPDEDEEFDAYALTVTITVTTTVTQVTENGVTTTTTTVAVTDATYSVDTDSTNQKYTLRAWNYMSGDLLDGADADGVDARTGATCSSEALRQAWKSALSGVTLGTTVTSDEGEQAVQNQTSVTTYSGEYSATVTVEPDEDEEFDPYEMTLTLTITTTVTETTVNGSTTVTTAHQVTDATYSIDTSVKKNITCTTKAWNGLVSSLTEGNMDVDAVSGATCSCNAIRQAWSQALQTVTVTVSISAVDAMLPGEEKKEEKQ